MKLHVAIPVLDELDYLFDSLDALARQTFSDFKVWICVNQPDAWWDDSEKVAICERNALILAKLREQSSSFGFPIALLDRSSKGKGWRKGQGCVGRARRLLMDSISDEAEYYSIIVSLDADTDVESLYFQNLIEIFARDSSLNGICVPFFHKLTGDERVDRAILRYEIYLRYYELNMMRIGSIYDFTALGSAMAFPVWAYRKVGGLTPRKSGEDFYFMEKLVKTGTVAHNCDCSVFPQARFSNRVMFGTGPAMIKGSNGDWSSYPLFHMELFDEVGETIALFPELYKHNCITPMSPFLERRFKTDDIWSGLRKNHSSERRFIHACHERIDGLRIFQYLRSENARFNFSDEDNLIRFLRTYHKKRYSECLDIDFSGSDIEELDFVRNILVGIMRDLGR